MFDVLVYLYENYWRPDACPSHEQLSRKLSAVGFESDEIQDALTWLDGLASSAEACAGAAGRAAACASTPTPSASCWARSRSASSASSNRPACCRRRCARWWSTAPPRSATAPIDLDDLKIIVLMVFWSLGEEPDALILDELFVDARKSA